MKVKASELTGPALDWAVAKCEGYDGQFNNEVGGPWLVPQEGYLHDEKPLGMFRPSINWALGGPIIDREKIAIEPYVNRHGNWRATCTTPTKKELRVYGPTPLVAAMRCYVASKLGDEINIPEELMK